jgi:hypothetical protein
MPDGMNHMLRIGEFSRLGRVSIKALRHYDEIGLLMVCVAHDKLDDTASVFLAVSERAQALGYEIAGPMHELYFPAAESAFAVMEIQFPLRRATGAALSAHHN